MSDERENDLTDELAELITQEIQLIWNNLENTTNFVKKNKKNEWMDVTRSHNGRSQTLVR